MPAIERITAAASRIIGKKSGKSQSGGGTSTGWQILAYELNDEVPEVNAYSSWVGNTAAGATLFAGRRGPDGDVVPEPEDSRAAQLVKSIAGGPDGQSELLGSFGTHLAIAGEAWLVIIPEGSPDSYADDDWHVLSIEEVKAGRSGLTAFVGYDTVDIPEYNPDEPTPPDAAIAIRVWRPSPRRRVLATSPVRSSITILEELRLLNAAVAAVTRSRITGRGILLVPAGASFPSTPGQQDASDSLLDTMIEVASTAIREPESAAATVPIMLEVPGDLIGSVKWLNFESGYDDLLLRLRDEAVRRFAAGVDVPAEILLGNGDSNHWNLWLLQAEALQLGVEPVLATVCQALTSQWLRPLLEDEGVDGAGELMVWYDTSALRTSGNKANSAIEAFKEGIISAEAARRELGFNDSDSPTSPAAQNPPATETGTDAVTTSTSMPVNETHAMPAQTGLPTRTASAAVPAASSGRSSSRDDALVAAVDGLAWSALTAAGQKLRQTPAVPRSARSEARSLTAAVTHVTHPVKVAELIDVWRLLAGAWDRVPEIAERYGLDSESLTAALDGYVRGLLVTGQPHDYDHIRRLLVQSGTLQEGDS